MLAALPLLLAWSAAAADPPASAPAEGEAPAAEAGSGLSFLLDVYGNKERCNAGNARPVVFEVLARGGTVRDGECVVVRGYLAGRALFGTPGHTRIRRAQSTDVLKEQRVGLYGLSRVLREDAPAVGYYRVVGTVGECARLGRDGMMVMGYCHYTNGPYLAVSELRRIR